MEKKTYSRPVLEFEQFLPNYYCAACITGVRMQCAIPGTSDTKVNDGTTARRGANGNTHGICANPVEVNIDLGTGTEISHSTVKPHAFHSFQLGEKVSGENASISGYDEIGTANYDTGWHKAHWISEDDDELVYYHYGLVNVTQIDPTHPYHS